MRWVMRAGALASVLCVLVLAEVARGEDKKTECLAECRDAAIECERIGCGEEQAPDRDSECKRQCGEKYNQCKQKCG